MKKPRQLEHYCPDCEEDVLVEWDAVPGLGEEDEFVAVCPLCGEPLDLSPREVLLLEEWERAEWEYEQMEERKWEAEWGNP